MEVGRNLGPYEIIEPLGKGGMGEVWLAEDTRLGRKVAVKVLPVEFASDPERLARFEQEARAAAALNHPHIAAVHDVGHEDGTHFMVQEYLQGQSLREALEPGALPLDKALKLGTEIAEALRAAHRAGIVHRDLKPENIFVTLDGHAKVLDFGLAKLTEVATGAMGSQSMSPTVLGTQAGSVMGTAGYMAPEQVLGEDVDHRADLFAFGCVLYELVTGQRAFAGKSVPHTLHKILDQEPDGFEAAADDLPLRLRWLLQRCLAKSADSRAQSAGDVAVELQQIAREVESGTAVSGDRAGSSGRGAAAGASGAGLSLTRAIPAALVLVLLGSALAWLLTPSSETAGLGPVRFTIALPEGIDDFSNRNQKVLAFSPDGRFIAFIADNQLWLRALDALQPVPLRGTAEPRSPSFSPDSSQLAFWADDQIKRIGVTGGAPVAVGASAGRPQGVQWAGDGFIYVGAARGDGIWRLPETGGQPELVVDMKDEEVSAYGPKLLPGGEWLMFTTVKGSDWDSGQIVAQSLASGERRVLVQGGHDAQLSPTGHLLYVTGGVLLASRFDLDTLQVEGGAVPLLEGVRSASSQVSGAAYFDLSATGALAFVAGAGDTGMNRLAWVDHEGKVEQLPIAATNFGSNMTLSPDGKQLAIEMNENEGSQVWVYEMDRLSGQRLTTLPSNGRPVWSADGEWVYFASSRNGGRDLWRRRADLSGPEEEVLAADSLKWPTSISGDGQWLYYVQASADGADIWRLPLQGGGEPEAVVATPATEVNGIVSPDGRHLAFVSRETGQSEVFVIELDTNRRWRVSADQGTGPTWSAVRNEIYYVWEQGVFVVEFEMEPEFNPEVARLLHPHPAGQLFGVALAPDGGRILARFSDDSTVQVAAPHIDVVLNWFEELMQRAPTER